MAVTDRWKSSGLVVITLAVGVFVGIQIERSSVSGTAAPSGDDEVEGPVGAPAQQPPPQLESSPSAEPAGRPGSAPPASGPPKASGEGRERASESAEPPSAPGEETRAAGPPERRAVRGALDKKDIDAGIRDQMPAILECYQGWLSQNPELEGKLKVKFVIAAREDDPEVGRVKKIELVDTTVDHVWMEGCVLSAVEDAEFAPPAGGGVVIVTYPLNFSSEED